MPTNAGVHDIEAIIIKEDNTRGHPLGLKEMGEIGSAGTAVAIGNTMFHTTGVRLTVLPFRLHPVLAGLAKHQSDAKA